MRKEESIVDSKVYIQRQRNIYLKLKAHGMNYAAEAKLSEMIALLNQRQRHRLSELENISRPPVLH